MYCKFVIINIRWSPCSELQDFNKKVRVSGKLTIDANS